MATATATATATAATTPTVVTSASKATPFHGCGRNLVFIEKGDKKDKSTHSINQSHFSYGNSMQEPVRGSPYSSSSALTHLQNDWPGKTGNGRHLDLRRMQFDILLSGDRIVIPIFQRRYCWTCSQIERWWKDVSSKCVGDHATHKTLFKKNLDSSTNKNALVCLDGQQRLTTTTIFLMALRAEARQQSRGNLNVKNLIQKIDSKLFTNVKAILGMKRWARDEALQMVRTKSKNCLSFTMPTLTPGWLPPFETILTPSYIDRAAYFELLCKDYVLEALEQQLQKTSQNNNKIEIKFSSTCQESVQHTAFNIFADKLQRFTALATPQGSVKSSLNKLYKRQMTDFSIMYVELLTNDNMQQIFLWMQEKSVFGMGKLLVNDSPGVDFNHVDLARNLIISSFMNEPLEVQVQFYKSCWIDPLEERFGTEGVRRILEAMVKSISTQKESRHIGDMEKKLNEFKAATPILMRDAYSEDKPMMIYSRFHSYVQKRAMEMNKGNPHAISREVTKSIVQEMVVIGKSLENAWS